MQARHIHAITVVQIVAVALLAWLLVTLKAPWDFQRCAGTLLVVIGVAGIVMARYHLGKSFAIAPEAHQLVTTGVYSKIRNPIYTFGVVMLTGIALMLQRPWFWLLIPAVIVAQTLRARRETAVLEQAFGDQYREYRRKTWF